MFYSKFKELVNDKSKEIYTVEELLEYFGESTILVGLIISNIHYQFAVTAMGWWFRNITRWYFIDYLCRPRSIGIGTYIFTGMDEEDGNQCNLINRK